MAGFCNLCGRSTNSNGYFLRHPRWHGKHSLRVCMQCYRQNAHCHICGIPLPGNASDPICQTCRLHLVTCIGCGEPIITQHYHTIGDQGPYCQACRQQPPICDVCGGVLGKLRWQLSDGRQFCDNCYSTTVNDPSEAAELYMQVQAWLDNRLGLSLNVPTSLALVDRNQLAQVMEKQSDQPLEPPDRTLGIYTRRGVRRGIYVQTGLPRLLFRQVSAHELAHAWQGENCPLLQNSLVREGFAEWVAYKCLEDQRETTQQRLMTQRSDVYGQGLRWALDIEQKQGARSVIDACRHSN